MGGKAVQREQGVNTECMVQVLLSTIIYYFYNYFLGHFTSFSDRADASCVDRSCVGDQRAGRKQEAEGRTEKAEKRGQKTKKAKTMTRRHNKVIRLANGFLMKEGPLHAPFCPDGE